MAFGRIAVFLSGCFGAGQSCQVPMNENACRYGIYIPACDGYDLNSLVFGRLKVGGVSGF